LVVGDDDLAEVDADAVLEGDRRAVGGGQGPAQAGLEAEGEADGVGGAGEHQEEGVAGGVDLLAVGELAAEVADEGVVLLDEGGGGAVAPLLLEGGGTDEVGEDQRHQFGAGSERDGPRLRTSGEVLFRVHAHDERLRRRRR